jgi:hypothetical protein
LTYAAARRPRAAPGHVGCTVIKADGSRHLARVEADPLAQRPD